MHTSAPSRPSRCVSTVTGASPTRRARRQRRSVTPRTGSSDASEAATHAISSIAAAGSSRCPPTTWSVRTCSAPVKTVTYLCSRSVEALDSSSGCGRAATTDTSGAEGRDGACASGRRAGPSGRPGKAWRSRAKGYVGSDTRRREPRTCRRVQSSVAPEAKSAARASPSCRDSACSTTSSAGPSASSSRWPVCRPSTAAPSSQAPRRRVRSSRLSLTSAQRWSIASRPTWSVKARSASDGCSCSGSWVRWARSCSARARRRSGLFAESTTTWGPGRAFPVATGRSTSSSRTTWALAPPAPKELSAARRGWPSGRGQSRSSRWR
ncbi:hypothetical protein COSO111634_05230 [Corallococcus soli]